MFDDNFHYFPSFKVFKNLKSKIFMAKQLDRYVHFSSCGEQQLTLYLKLLAWQRFPQTLFYENRENVTSPWSYLQPNYQG